VRCFNKMRVPYQSGEFPQAVPKCEEGGGGRSGTARCFFISTVVPPRAMSC
jgi:hypothetical protein